MSFFSVLASGLSYVSPFVLPIKDTLPLNKREKEVQDARDIDIQHIGKVAISSLVPPISVASSLLFLNRIFSRQINWKLAGAVSFLVAFVVNQCRVWFFIKNLNQVQKAFEQSTYTASSIKTEKELYHSYFSFLLQYPLALEIVSKNIDVWEDRSQKMCFYFPLFLTFLSSGCIAGVQRGEMLLQKLNELGFENGGEPSIFCEFTQEFAALFKEGQDSVKAKEFLAMHCPALFLYLGEKILPDTQESSFYSILPSCFLRSENFSKLVTLGNNWNWVSETKKMEFFLALLFLSLGSKSTQRENIRNVFLENVKKLDSNWVENCLFSKNDENPLTLHGQHLLAFFKKKEDLREVLWFFKERQHGVITFLGIFLLLGEHKMHPQTELILNELYSGHKGKEEH